MCPRKTFVIDVIIQELLIRRYWVPMKLDAVGLIANVENLKMFKLFILRKSD